MHIIFFITSPLSPLPCPPSTLHFSITVPSPSSLHHLLLGTITHWHIHISTSNHINSLAEDGLVPSILQEPAPFSCLYCKGRSRVCFPAIVIINSTLFFIILKSLILFFTFNSSVLLKFFNPSLYPTQRPPAQGHNLPYLKEMLRLFPISASAITQVINMLDHNDPRLTLVHSRNSFQP